MIVFLFATVYAQACRPYTGEICKGFVKETLLPTKMIEEQLTSLKELDQYKAMFPQCYADFKHFSCNAKLTSCQSKQIITLEEPPCKESCLRVRESCQDAFKTFRKESMLPNCDLLPHEKCIRSLAKLTETAVCPEPFLPRPADASDLNTCHAGCCLPCPATPVFYPSGQLKSMNHTLEIMSLISGAAALLVVISYLILPGKRSGSSLLVLCLGIGLSLWQNSYWIGFPDTTRVNCSADGVTPGTMFNNPYCAVQGSIIVFAVHAVVYWATAIIGNLHLQAVWHSSFVERHAKLTQAVCWGLPLLLAVIPVATGKIKSYGGLVCLIDYDYANFLFFYPQAVLIFPAFFVHMLTFYHITKVLKSNADVDQGKTRKNLIKIVQLQWRPFVMSFALILVYMVFWIYFFVGLSSYTKFDIGDEWVKDWITCMLSPLPEDAGERQTQCSHIAASSVPNFYFGATAGVLVSLCGLQLLLVIGLRQQIIMEWRQKIKQWCGLEILNKSDSLMFS